MTVVCYRMVQGDHALGISDYHTSRQRRLALFAHGIYMEASLYGDVLFLIVGCISWGFTMREFVVHSQNLQEGPM